jgi:hypothetical protein
MTTIKSTMWHAFDFLGFKIAGSIAERMSPHWPRFAVWIERGELIVTFGRREVIITPPWWRPRGQLAAHVERAGRP